MRFTFAATLFALASSALAVPMDSQAVRYAGLARAETAPVLATRECSSIPGQPDPNMMRIIYQTTRKRSTDPNVMIIVFITAWQESHIHNLDCGDRESFGLFQQQSRYGWGDHGCITNPVCSTNSFLNALLPAYSSGRSRGRTLGQIAQDVQKAIAGELYQQHVEYAKQLIGQTKKSLGDDGKDDSGSDSGNDGGDDKPTTTKTSTGGNGGAINVGGQPTPAPSKPTNPSNTKTDDGPKETPADDGKTDGECTQTYVPVPGDICYTVADRFGLKLEEFYALNPSIDAECQNLYAGQPYCVSTDPAKASST